MPKPYQTRTFERASLDLARVLLMHRELASRLALQTILQAGGYAVDVASTAGEAICKLDEGQYELVLSDSDFGPEREGRSVLAYARVKAYHPATALVTSHEDGSRRRKPGDQVSIYTENLPGLLADVAELIGMRATRRHRPLRQAV
jgi:CheY-like chemotaxis protein